MSGSRLHVPEKFGVTPWPTDADVRRPTIATCDRHRSKEQANELMQTSLPWAAHGMSRVRPYCDCCLNPVAITASHPLLALQGSSRPMDRSGRERYKTSSPCVVAYQRPQPSAFVSRSTRYTSSILSSRNSTNAPDIIAAITVPPISGLDAPDCHPLPGQIGIWAQRQSLSRNVMVRIGLLV